MFTKTNLKNVVFFDIETAQGHESYQRLDSEERELFMKKVKSQNPDNLPIEEVYEKAGLYAEFGRIVCISLGYFSDDDLTTFRVTSIQGMNERQLLLDLNSLLSSLNKIGAYILCGHNSKKFDIPFIARRCVILDVPIPKAIDVSGKKPWEVENLDTMEEWKVGDFQYNVSLRLLTKTLGIPSPKDDIDGSDVGRVFWEEQDFRRISVYCEKDVIAVANVALRFQGRPVLLEENITHV